MTAAAVLARVEAVGLTKAERSALLEAAREGIDLAVALFTRPTLRR